MFIFYRISSLVMMNVQVVFFIFFVFVHEISCATQCKTEGCLTLKDMGSGWGGYFENEENAPCLNVFKDGVLVR